jgi:hypothetical protein
MGAFGPPFLILVSGHITRFIDVEAPGTVHDDLTGCSNSLSFFFVELGRSNSVIESEVESGRKG